MPWRYEISSALSQKEDKLVQLQLRRDRHETRIQAMTEGESYVNFVTRKPLNLDIICLNCDFSEPSIAINLKKIEQIRSHIRKYFGMQPLSEKADNYRTNAK